jgi:hypothetical protein
MSVGRMDSPSEDRPRPQQLDFAMRSASAPPSPILQPVCNAQKLNLSLSLLFLCRIFFYVQRNAAPADVAPETIDVSSLRAMNNVVERGYDMWHQFESMFPVAVSWAKTATAYWSRMRASDERAWLAGNLMLGIIVMYIFFTPFLFVLRAGVLAFVLFSCWYDCISC